MRALRRVGRGERLLDSRLTNQVFAKLREMRERERLLQRVSHCMGHAVVSMRPATQADGA